MPPVNPGLSSWNVSIEPMASAYKTLNGAEPDFTNNAKVRDEPLFIETLDYIFYNYGSKSNYKWNVKQVRALPGMSEGLSMGPMPGSLEPSDHLMIAATLELSHCKHGNK